MAIRSRSLRAVDVHQAAHLIPNRLPGPGGRHFDAVAACRRLLAAGEMVGTVVETIVEGNAGEIVGIGGAVFVADEFIAAERERPMPGLAERILARVLDGTSPVLRLEQIAEANRGAGLNVVTVLHHWASDRINTDQGREVRMHLMTTFLDDFRGYRLREILSEAVGEHELKWGLAGGGFVLRSDYAEWYEKHLEPLPRRYQGGITRDEALAVESSVTAILFHYHPPQFAFTGSQRQLLRIALRHQTDAEIAAEVDVSLSAVKKGWAAIFDRVSERTPGLLWDGNADMRSNMTRGPQKRHRLLTYLRAHLEEVRP
jgi:hypothetical protein